MPCTRCLVSCCCCVVQYIDYVGSWGPAIVGHAHPEVTAALAEQIKKVRVCCRQSHTKLKRKFLNKSVGWPVQRNA